MLRYVHFVLYLLDQTSGYHIVFELGTYGHVALVNFKAFMNLMHAKLACKLLVFDLSVSACTLALYSQFLLLNISK